MKMCADSEHFENVIKREHGVLPLVQGVIFLFLIIYLLPFVHFPRFEFRMSG